MIAPASSALASVPVVAHAPPGAPDVLVGDTELVHELPVPQPAPAAAATPSSPCAPDPQSAAMDWPNSNKRARADDGAGEEPPEKMFAWGEPLKVSEAAPFMANMIAQQDVAPADASHVEMKSSASGPVPGAGADAAAAALFMLASAAPAEETRPGMGAGRAHELHDGADDDFDDEVRGRARGARAFAVAHVRKTCGSHRLSSVGCAGGRGRGVTRRARADDAHPREQSNEEMEDDDEDETSDLEARHYTGVYWDKGRNKWKAQIAIDTKLEALGRYDKKSDAARAYDRRARMLGRGVNFPRRGEARTTARRRPQRVLTRRKPRRRNPDTKPRFDGIESSFAAAESLRAVASVGMRAADSPRSGDGGGAAFDGGAASPRSTGQASPVPSSVISNAVAPAPPRHFTRARGQLPVTSTSANDSANANVLSTVADAKIPFRISGMQMMAPGSLSIGDASAIPGAPPASVASAMAPATAPPGSAVAGTPPALELASPDVAAIDF